ncbi:hypothetical protein DFH94DRAFT_849359 [Russula ochroleuca]|uniref:DUF6534 domain-containing protein n=1 Tax=Russula ochroleuca TaxID=152965 RepID=A0A9P5TE23_9AGAM|nr:hypothetical protein DFH94DRAFT_849359 [Russula ochroleuca]
MSSPQRIPSSEVEDFAAPQSSAVSVISPKPDQLVYVFVHKKMCTATTSPGTVLLPDKDFAVYSIFFLETVETILSGADLYYWFAAHFGNVNDLLNPFASSFDVPILGSVVAITVQLFFVYRIMVLSEKRSRWLCLIISLLSIISASGAFASSITTYMGDGQVKKRSIDVFEVIWLAANTFSDLLIAFAMLYHLRRIWARDGNLSNHILVSIVRLTIETNFVTAAVGIISLLMIGVFQHKDLYLCPTSVLGKLYSNTLLVSLNNRISIRNTYESRNGKVFDFQVVSVPGSTRLDVTKDTINLEAEQSQEDLRNQPVAETEVEERVNNVV